MGAALAAAALVCLSAAGHVVSLPATRFTLAWQHSIEKIDWEEDYVVAGPWLYLSGARVRGTGAGMEPPDEAERVSGVYVYRPAQRWFPSLTLARSGFVQDYRLCIDGRCRPMSDWVPVDAGVTTVAPCGETPPRAVKPSPAATSPSEEETQRPAPRTRRP